MWICCFGNAVEEREEQRLSNIEKSFSVLMQEAIRFALWALDNVWCFSLQHLMYQRASTSTNLVLMGLSKWCHLCVVELSSQSDHGHDSGFRIYDPPKPIGFSLKSYPNDQNLVIHLLKLSQNITIIKVCNCNKWRKIAKALAHRTSSFLAKRVKFLPMTLWF